MYPSSTSTFSTLSSSYPLDLVSVPVLLQRIRGLGFDAIRYASYRTAAKLRFIQRETSVDLVDLWNIIEAFRENGLNGLDPSSTLTLPQLQSILYSLYLNLNKRLPQGQQVDPDMGVRELLSWLLLAYHSESNVGLVRVFSIKVGLVSLCNGKLVDKFRYIFSLISDGGGDGGGLVMSGFQDYLDQVLELPRMVFESPAFPPSPDLASTIFNGRIGGDGRVLINEFLETLLGETGGPLSLIWIPLIELIGEAENVNHGVPCSVCRSHTIQGLRYKCVKCSNFNLCQNCFWQGKTSENHRNEHQVKEYSRPPKVGVGGLGSSFRKSFRCVPKGKKIPGFQDQPQRPLNLNYILPSSPLPFRCNPGGGGGGGGTGLVFPPSAYSSSKVQQLELDEGMRNEPPIPHGQWPPPPSVGGSAGSSCGESWSGGSDEEHRLIAFYTARLASEGKYSREASPLQHQNHLGLNLFNNTRAQREMIAKLEARNRDILREIGRLRCEQAFGVDGDSSVSLETVVMDELVTLRYHESDLEEKLNGLKDSRNHLMGQIQGLMKLLQAQEMSGGGGGGGGRVVKSSWNGCPPYGGSGSGGIRSAPTTPQHSTPQPTSTSFNSLGRRGELRSAYISGEDEFPSFSTESTESRNDLLLAADSVTHAMSSLVSQLNGDEEDYSPPPPPPPPLTGTGLRNNLDWDTKGERLRRMADEEKYLQQLRNIRLSQSEGDSDELDLEGQVNELLGQGGTSSPDV